jgi:hypothetical protein
MATRRRKKSGSDTDEVLALIAQRGVDAAIARCPDAAAMLRALVDGADAAVAQQPDPFDVRDSVRDRLFALIMQRIDVLQAQRIAYQRIMVWLISNPSQLRTLAPALHSSLQQMLRRADAGNTPAHIAGLAVAYIAIITVWRNDTTTDLSKTMKACDRALSVLDNIARLG